MKTRVFISRQNQGWTEIQIPEVYRNLTYEKLVSRIHIYLKQFSYKGVLITENPSPWRNEKACT